MRLTAAEKRSPGIISAEVVICNAAATVLSDRLLSQVISNVAQPEAEPKMTPANTNTLGGTTLILFS
jgi:hypothetical protein